MSKPYKVSNNDLKILRNLYQNSEGLRVQTLFKLTNIKPITLYKRLNILRNEMGLIENIFPIWKISNGGVEKCRTLLKDNNIFELHNLSFVIPLIQTPDWWKKRSKRLTKLKGFQFKQIEWGKSSSNPYQQLINENYVIQTYPESIIVIFRKRYYSNNPYNTIIQATNDFLDMWAWFEERMRFKFFKDGIPQIKLRSNDFNRIKDYLAEHCKKRGEGFLIEIPSGKVWVDYSEPFGKESNYPEAQEILEKVTKDHLINKPMLNSELQKSIQYVTENQMLFAQNIETHIEAIQTLSQTVKELKEEIKKINGKT